MKNSRLKAGAYSERAVTGVIPGFYKVHEQDHGDNLYVYKNGYCTELEALRAAHTAWLNSGSIRYTWISQEITYSYQ